MHPSTDEERKGLGLVGRRPAGQPSHGWQSLTSTERRIVDLVAEGLTNNQIAGELGISNRTVQGHLRRLFVKVGISSRKEITARANDQNA